MTPAAEPTARTGRVLDRPLVAFFAIAYALAWGLWLVVAWVAGQSGIGTDHLLRLVEERRLEGVDTALPGWLLYAITRVIDFSFSIAGLIMIGITAGKAGFRELGGRLLSWRFPVRWYLLALLPVFLLAVAAFLAATPMELNGQAVITALFSLEAGLLASLFLRGAMGEELGLRGFALPRLQGLASPFRASLIIGILWGLWHLPVLISRDPVSIVLFLVMALGLSFVFTLMFNGSGGSLIPGLLFHATVNWEEGFEALMPGLVGTDWEIWSTLGLLIVGLVAAVMVARRPRFGQTHLTR
ncbi:MAG TPA: CPBP family intramembrane glutamic endopeptidase [Arachnia sp.]|nr:CPBP family intramembrane glutamic endopeptidase [Arachnia sp.]